MVCSMATASLYGSYPASICRTVKNHGIPENAIQGAVEAGKKFFALPTDTKLEVCDYEQALEAKLMHLNSMIVENRLISKDILPYSVKIMTRIIGVIYMKGSILALKKVKSRAPCLEEMSGPPKRFQSSAALYCNTSMCL